MRKTSNLVLTAVIAVVCGFMCAETDEEARREIYAQVATLVAYLVQEKPQWLPIMIGGSPLSL